MDVNLDNDYYKGNISRVSGSAKAADRDYHLHLVELHNSGPSLTLTMAGFIAFCSGILNKPVQSQIDVATLNRTHNLKYPEKSVILL
ncbi:hypothetical protein KFZ76_21410 [Methylovulum psychrotolerans]|uniref:hypothetical protein n=1 Tax=Methylovulum psychrotolerans TaxID=1704499 RepID=UPI001BFFAEC6|nr:hypothetical protein [Methylovulum psychrotolerans]MBT9100261.1 hypothetical protein [Methylovulum psychrotolerans]